MLGGLQARTAAIPRAAAMSHLSAVRSASRSKNRASEAEAVIRQALSPADSIDDKFQDLRSFAAFMLALALGSQGRVLGRTAQWARRARPREGRVDGFNEPECETNARIRPNYCDGSLRHFSAVEISPSAQCWPIDWKN